MNVWTSSCLNYEGADSLPGVGIEKDKHADERSSGQIGRLL